MKQEVKSVIDIALRLYSDRLNSDFPTQVLGISPSDVFNEGDRIKGRNGKLYGCHSRTAWILTRKYSGELTLSGALSEFLAELDLNSPKMKAVRSEGFLTTEIYIGFFRFSESSDFWIDHNFIKIFEELDLDLGFSFY